MARHLEVEGERWEVRLGTHNPHPGVATVIFYPRNNQRAYRVLEVEGARFASQDAIEQLDDEALLELFRGADIMDYVHERGADPHHETAHVDTPPDVNAS